MPFDHTTFGSPLTASASIAQGRMSGPMTYVATPAACASALVINTVHPAGVLEARDPTSITTMAIRRDGEANAAILRAVDPTGHLGDADLLTFTSHMETGPFTGNLFKTCTNFATTSIEGDSSISGVIIHAFCRVTHDEAITITAPQFIMVGQSVAMSSPPHGADSEGVVPADCVSALLTTHDGVHAWTWANIFTALAGLKVQVHVVYEGFATPVSFDLAELWVDVYGPIGSAPDPIIMRQKVGVTMRMSKTIGNVAPHQKMSETITKRTTLDSVL